MDVLRVLHSDFELVVRCNNFAALFSKAKSKQPAIYSATSYHASSGEIHLVDPESDISSRAPSVAHPVFFENKEYNFLIKFSAAGITRARIISKIKDVEDRFIFDPGFGLWGTINFVNDLGKSQLIVSYGDATSTKVFSLEFEVFPTKLDFRHDYDQVVADIEAQYPHLILDFLKKTYSGFTPGNARSSDLIWWQIFGGLYEDFLRASKLILNKPHNRIIRKSRNVQADRIKTWTKSLEEEFAEHKHISLRRYVTEYKALTIDTPENRFFKHAAFQTTARFRNLKAKITKQYSDQISISFLSELNTIERRMLSLASQPFFKAISQFRGIRQESLVLHKASGYSSIFRCWVMLNSGLKLLNGVERIELKNIADLYQIWCFLEIKAVLQELLGDPEKVELAEIQVDDFVFKIVRGHKSKVTYLKPNGERVELFHDFSFDRGSNDDLRSFTVNQRPDIVLRISKNDLRDNYVLTYLYDAKYRLQSDDKTDAPDWPPEDAINQMHRYRDAIYYVDNQKRYPEKEVIGGYVLFPGSGDKDKVKSSKYFRSIDTVNIGAFPLRPNDDVNKELLAEHLRGILGIDTESVLKKIAPQKHSSYETSNPEVLIGIVPNKDHAECLEGDRPFYYTGRNKPTRFGYKALRYFAPYIQGSGVREYFEILDYEIILRSKIFQPGHKLYKPVDRSERLLLRLGQRFQIAIDNEFLKLSDGSIWHFRYTSLVHLRTPVHGKINVHVVSRTIPA